MVVLVAGVLAWLTQHTEYLAGHLTVVVNRVLADHSDMVLEVRDLRGNVFRSVTIVEPRLRIRGDTGPALLEARSMALRYAPWDLAFGSRRSLEIELERPVVHLVRGPDGKLRLPHWRPGPPGRGPAREFDVRLAVNGGEVHLPDSSQDVRGLVLRARALLGEAGRGRGAADELDAGPAGHDARGAARAAWSPATARASSCGNCARPTWRSRPAGAGSAGARTRFAAVDLERVRWRWLAKVFANELFDVPGEGGGRFDVRFDRAVSGTGLAEAVWDSVPLKARAGFRWEGGRLTIAPLDGTSPAGAFARTRRVHGEGPRSARPRHAREPASSGARSGCAGWPAGDLTGEMHYWSWREAPAGSRFEADLGRLGAGGLAGGLGARPRWTRRRRRPARSTSLMLRRGGRVELDADMDHGTWQGTWQAARFPLDEWPDGRATGIRGMLGEGRGTAESRERRAAGRGHAGRQPGRVAGAAGPRPGVSGR